MPGCFLDPFQEYHRAQFENQHSRPRDPLYKKVAMYKTASCDDLSLSGCLVLLQQGSHSGDNNLDTVMQREYWPGGAASHLQLGPSLSGLSMKAKMPSSSPPPVQSQRRSTFFRVLSRRRSQQGRGCPWGCCRPCGRNGSPGLALSLCWVRLRTLWLERGAGTPSTGLEAWPESQDVGLYHHCQGELLLSSILCSVLNPLLGDAESTNFELLNSSCLSSDIAPTGPRRRPSSGQLALGLCTWSSEACGVERAPPRVWGWLPEGWKPLGQQSHLALLPAASACPGLLATAPPTSQGCAVGAGALPSPPRPSPSLPPAPVLPLSLPSSSPPHPSLFSSSFPPPAPPFPSPPSPSPFSQPNPALPFSKSCISSLQVLKNRTKRLASALEFTD